MRATNKIESMADKKTVDTVELQTMLSSGRKTAVEIGTAAQARVQVGRRVLWNVGKIQKYLDAISEQEDGMDDLRNILPTGKSNAISARELAAKIGVSDRVLRDIVTEDRV